ncbi:hypothetical protein [Actinomadura sp. 3N407]|uniref:hypothetical protein n=1 Tax=Actinomadura sp. 3N407 TaxID=3457423 RepID=UPI003FCDEB44
MDSLDADPFASPGTSKRIDCLFHVRRATHRFLVRHAATLWAQEQQHRGRLMAPPPLAAPPDAPAGTDGTSCRAGPASTQRRRQCAYTAAAARHPPSR